MKKTSGSKSVPNSATEGWNAKITNFSSGKLKFFFRENLEKCEKRKEKGRLGLEIKPELLQ